MTDLQIVWPKQWMADDFAAAGCNVTHHSGFEVVEQRGPIWWTTEDAARSIVAGHEVWLQAPDFRDFTELPKGLLGREVRAVNLRSASNMHREAFVKPADCKIVGPEDCGRAMVANVATWAKECLDFGVNSSTVVLISDPISFDEEWRCWYDGTRVTEASLYLRDGVTWDEFPAEEIPLLLGAFAEVVGKEVKQPCTIDVGLVKGAPVLVELNPVWSSGIYTSDYWKIYQAILAGWEFARSGRGTKWEPELWLLEQARRRRL